MYLCIHKQLYVIEQKEKEQVYVLCWTIIGWSNKMAYLNVAIYTTSLIEENCSTKEIEDNWFLRNIECQKKKKKKERTIECN